MKFLVLDGNPDDLDTAFQKYLTLLGRDLENLGNEVCTLVLRDLDIRYCTGCWGCWVKTPGKCVFEDDSYEVCREYIRSDFVLLASPVFLGFTTALLKKAQDRLIPLLHPYMELVQGERHHVRRYVKYPRLGVLVQGSGETDEEDMDIIKDIYVRFALNFKTGLVFFGDCSQPVKEVANALNSL